jgi:MFS transporter, DHA1 family, tetracycline resistance protein
MTTTALEGSKGNGRQMGALFLIVFISLVGFGIVLPAFPFFGTMVGASPAETTLAMAAYSLGQFVGAPVWGKLSDTYGRKPILIGSLAGAILSYIIMAHARDIVTLSAARLFGGLMAGNIAAAFAYVGDITDEASRPKAMGIIGAAFGLGFIFVTIGYASAGFAALAIISAFLFLPESLTSERRALAKSRGSSVKAADVLKAKPIIWVLMALSLLAIGSGALMETSFAFFAHDELGWGPQQVGLSFGAVGLVSVILQGGGAAPLAKRFGSPSLMIAGLVFYAVGISGLTIAQSGHSVLFAMCVMAVGIGLFNPAFQTVTSAQSDDHDRGLVNGMTQGASSLGRVIGPSMSGTIYQNIGTTAPFAFGAVGLTLALGIAVVAIKGLRGTSE